MNSIFFNSWESLLRTAILAVCSYIALVVLVRISGKRTLSKMNAFDFLLPGNCCSHGHPMRNADVEPTRCPGQ